MAKVRKTKTQKKTKGRPGRPKGIPNPGGDGIVRLETIAFRVSDQERREIERKAGSAGQGVGLFVREALRAAGVIGPVRVPKATRTEARAR